jgi:Rha family phage regulatory protein
MENKIEMNAERQPIVRITDAGEAMADSRDVAAYFSKQHKNVLRDIRALHCSDEFRRLNFEPIYIKDLTGDSLSHILMTKDGFLFLVLGFGGDAAGKLKEAYIRQFNAMEEELRRRKSFDATTILNDPAAMRGILLSYTEKVIALEAEKAAMAPKVEALERIAEADGSLCITDAAKTLQVRPQELFRFLRSHNWIYRRVGADHDCAYQAKLASGLLEHKTSTVTRSDGSEKVTTQVRVTPKGLTRLAQEFPSAARVA